MPEGAKETFPLDPFTFFREWYNATSETWSKAAESAVGSEQFMELNKRFLESYASFYKTFRQVNEEYLRNLQLPTRSDVARVAELVVALEEKIDRIEDTLEDSGAGQTLSATSETLKSLEDRLERVESKLDSILAALEKVQTQKSQGNDSSTRKSGRKKQEPSGGQG